MIIGGAIPPQLWHVDTAGNADKLGDYPPHPLGFTPYYGIKLDATNRLYELGFGQPDSKDIVLRREIGGESQIVYDESTDPLVKLYMSDLITGP